MQAMVLYTIVATVFISVATYGFTCAARKVRRRRARAKPFPRDWSAILENNLLPYRCLRREDRNRLEGLINVFLEEKRFEGCGGLELTDEIRVTIAAEACLLVLHRPDNFYKGLKSVLVYPGTYEGSKEGLFTKPTNSSVRLGESWTTGAVVLAWDSVKRGAHNFDDGHNLAFHEFAHQLDTQDGSADGAPRLDSLSSYREWARVLSVSYEKLGKKTGQGGKTVMDLYGATNPAEFFAVATETFFEKPDQLLAKDPELFEELQSYYHLDPREWEDASA